MGSIKSNEGPREYRTWAEKNTKKLASEHALGTHHSSLQKHVNCVESATRNVTSQLLFRGRWSHYL